MADSRPTAKRVLHMIGNAHIDPVWAWRWHEGLAEVLATCRSAIDRMREFADFKFTRSCADVHRWIEMRDPVLFEAVRNRVRDGRWCVVGGWWVQPDCNIPCGESYVRQGLYGKLYFRERLDAEVRVGYNVDSFGHNVQLPQILKKLGLDYYVFLRPGPHEKDLPGPLFWWEGPDGSRVLCWRIINSYNTGPENIETHIRACASKLSDAMPEGMCFYGVGNHGGGPTRENLKSIAKLRGAPDMPELVMSSPEAFFRSAETWAADAPVVRDDLQHHAPGCYTSVTFIKRMNRICEEALLSAERLAAVAQMLTGGPAPQEEIETAWHNVLFNQFHDILAGTAIPAAYDDSEGQLEESLRTAEDIQNDSLEAIAVKVDTSGEGVPVVVFNSLPWARKAVVECELGFPGDEAHYAFAAIDPEGRKTPCNVEVTGEVGIEPWRKLTFVADLPPLGYRTWFLHPEDGQSRVNAAGDRVSSSEQELRIDPATGSIIAWQLKGRKLSVDFKAAAPLIVIDDPNDTWAHLDWTAPEEARSPSGEPPVLKSFRKEIGRFVPTGDPEVVRYGPVSIGVRFRGTFGRSWAEWEYILVDGIDLVELKLRLDWQERHRMLKLACPALPFDTVSTFSAPYGFIMRRQSGDEEPAQQWVDVSGRYEGGVCGLSLITESTYGYDVKDSEIRASLLRSPIFCFHDPRRPRSDVRYQYADQGPHDYRMWLKLHKGGWRSAGLTRLGSELVCPAVALPEPAHEGELPSANSFLEIGPDTVAATVVKRAESSFEDIIVRFHETTGEPGTAFVRSEPFGWDWRGRIGPCEIKTLRISPSGRILETNLLEEIASDSEAPDAPKPPSRAMETKRTQGS